MNQPNYLLPVYVAYILSSLGLTVYLARVLSQHGGTFLKDVFPANEDLAKAVNKLLVVGFYLMNFGYAAMMMEAVGADSPVKAMEVFAWKLGSLLLSLGAMHFFNLFVFYRIRRRAQVNSAPPPVAPRSIVSRGAVADAEVEALAALVANRDRRRHAHA